jgi:hypothetical protein
MEEVMIAISLSRRVVWTLFAIVLASSAAADSYHPHIVKSQVVSLDVAAIERYAQSGTPFELNLGETSLKIALSPEPVWPKEGLTVIEVAEDGAVKQRVVNGNITYAGAVVGEDPEVSEARFGIAHGVWTGM